ncbi:NifB/NifX family molybdenum-iron cluster-binding protein [bacterium]|nr:NifB/NifX family molybdenum-iron cluster-binding protein [bacterium]
MKLKIACGTDDKKIFTNNHFGDSKYFLIYEYDLENKNIEFAEKINNNSEDEEEHGDIKKAKSISDVLKEISVLVAFVMGPNIARMRKKFVPVISREKNIEKTLNKIKEDMVRIIKESQLPDGQDKKIFIIN